MLKLTALAAKIGVAVTLLTDNNKEDRAEELQLAWDEYARELHDENNVEADTDTLKATFLLFQALTYYRTLCQYNGIGQKHEEHDAKIVQAEELLGLVPLTQAAE